jgi:hypothetical protein
MSTDAVAGAEVEAEYATLPFYRTGWFFAAALIAALVLPALPGVLLAAAALVVLWRFTSHTRRWAVTGPATRVTRRQKLAASAAGALVLLASLIRLGGAGDTGCSSAAAQDLVLQIAGDEVKQQTEAELRARNPFDWPPYTQPNTKTMDKIAALAGSLGLADIRTDDKNAATGAVSCAARLRSSMTMGKGSDDKVIDTQITYTLQRTDEGKLYATVFGLR